MKILIWATTLQADILALSLYLYRQNDCDVMVVAEHPSQLLGQPLWKLGHVPFEVLDRENPKIEDMVRKFSPDVTVCDNHLPTFLRRTRLFSMWHGLGWKARGRADIKTFYRNVAKITGADPLKDATRFRAQCYGEPDRQWRIQNWGLPAESCITIGSCFSDLLLSPPFNKETLQPFYQVDITQKKTVLLSISWHYGRISGTAETKKSVFGTQLSNPNDDTAYIRRLLEKLESLGASTIFCLHDKKRYEPEYLAQIHQTAAAFEHVQLKHKCEHPDNLADLVAADVMVSNLSSFITFFYYSGFPAVHIVPSVDDLNSLFFSQIKNGKVRYRKVQSKESPYMNHPDDNGGISVRNEEAVLQAIESGLNNPHIGEERAQQWISNHIYMPNGHTCERFLDALRRFVEK